jgi:hypothetical protein
VCVSIWLADSRRANALDPIAPWNSDTTASPTRLRAYEKYVWCKYDACMMYALQLVYLFDRKVSLDRILHIQIGQCLPARLYQCMHTIYSMRMSCHLGARMYACMYAYGQKLSNRKSMSFCVCIYMHLYVSMYTPRVPIHPSSYLFTYPTTWYYKSCIYVSLLFLHHNLLCKF